MQDPSAVPAPPPPDAAPETTTAADAAVGHVPIAPIADDPSQDGHPAEIAPPAADDTPIESAAAAATQDIVDADAAVAAAVAPNARYVEICETVKCAVLADGVPEGEFARDFPLPIERREALITRIGEALGIVTPTGDDLINAAANLINVGEMIDVFVLQDRSRGGHDESTS